MDLYHKLRDTQRCIPFTSSQPNHCKQNIPFCLAQRIYTTAENNAEKLKNLEKLKSHLSKKSWLISNKTSISEGPFNTTKTLTKI